MEDELIRKLFKRFKDELELEYNIIGIYPKITKDKFTIIDNNGYLYYNNYNGLLKNIKRGSKMDFISCHNPYTIHNLKIWLHNNLPQITLIGDEFSKAKSKLKFKCDVCGEFESTWDDIYHGAGCPKCNYNKKYEPDDLYRYLNDLSSVVGIKYNLLCGEYIRSQYRNLTIVDEYGYKYLCSLYYIIKCVENSSKLPIFDNYFTNENIDNYIRINNIPYTRITSEYYDVFSKMKFLCNKHNCEFEASLNQLRYNTPCKECYKESITGENSASWKGGKIKYNCDSCGKECYTDVSAYKQKDSHYCSKECAGIGYSKKYIGENNPNWNHGKTLEEREIGRSYTEYHQFIKSVMDRDNYKCVNCGKSNTYFEIHHLDGYSWCEDGRVDINNGITLCKECHKDFHIRFGNKNNTYEQYLEYISDNESIYALL